jgi:signal transduction histidine kinase
LKHLARESEQLLGVPCEVVRSDRPAALSDSAATHLYRIAQEAITNAVKHGNAGHIEIACERQQQQLVLTIGDDGCGLCESAGESGGMGLHIMRYRARSLGGELSVASRQGGGTLVRCVCPWPSAGAVSSQSAPLG